MNDSHDIITGGNITNSQVGQTLTNCTNMIQQQLPGEKKELLESLQSEVTKLIAALPADKKDKEKEVVDDLKMLVEQATNPTPNRKWYNLSADGLLEASKWVGGFAESIGGTLGKLGKLIPGL